MGNFLVPDKRHTELSAGHSPLINLAEDAPFKLMVNNTKSSYYNYNYSKVALAEDEEHVFKQFTQIVVSFPEDFYKSNVASQLTNDYHNQFKIDHDDHPSMNTERSEEKSLSLQQCLELFSHEEQLNAENAWYCSQCKKHQEATKKIDLWRLPEILVVHLKRFSYSSIWRDKIDAFIDFPLK